MGSRLKKQGNELHRKNFSETNETKPQDFESHACMYVQPILSTVWYGLVCPCLLPGPPWGSAISGSDWTWRDSTLLCGPAPSGTCPAWGYPPCFRQTYNCHQVLLLLVIGRMLRTRTVSYTSQDLILVFSWLSFPTSS